MITLRIRTEVDIDEAVERATFSIWLNDEAEAYTLRVERLAEDEILSDEPPAYRFAVRDDYTADDNLYIDWPNALAAAWDFYAETQTQYFDVARGIE